MTGLATAFGVNGSIFLCNSDSTEILCVLVLGLTQMADQPAPGDSVRAIFLPDFQRASKASTRRIPDGKEAAIYQGRPRNRPHVTQVRSIHFRIACDSSPNDAKRRATSAEFASHRVVHNDHPAIRQRLN
jgi:hypothetical protein